MCLLQSKQSVFIKTNFDNINLVEATIDAKEFDNCTFNNCNFTDTAFIKCKFYECQFINCNLSMLSVKGCSFYDISFEASKLIGVNWAEAAWPKIKLGSPLKFYKCALNHSSFFGLSLREIIMVECSAKEVDFREADCSAADFTYTDFAGSFFVKTDLSYANFTDAINYNINIFNNNIKKAKFALPEAVNLLNCLDIELVD